MSGFRRILVAVDDSPGGLDAARAAIDLAAGSSGELRAVTVLQDHLLAGIIGGRHSDTAARVAGGARSLLGWVAQAAAARGVPCQTLTREGEPFRRILEEADDWGADLIVMGRSDRRGPSSPYLGSETAHVLEFTKRPVLVVPPAEGHAPDARP